MLMQMFMDEVGYNEVGNTVTLVKNRSEDSLPLPQEDRR